MKIKIVKDSNPIMRKRSEIVNIPLSNEDRDILNSMHEYIIKSQDDEYASKHNIRPGVGLAAIQIGVLKRMFVVHIPMGDFDISYQVVNPKIIETSIRGIALSGGEGCLSVDKEHKGLVHRNYKIKIKFFDAIRNEETTLSLSGYPAIVFQHEYDHLDGKLFYDRIDKENPFKQKMNEEII